VTRAERLSDLLREAVEQVPLTADDLPRRTERHHSDRKNNTNCDSAESY
jgi:hypothetical protein